MILPLYILSLGASAGIVGAFCRHALEAQARLQDFEAGLALTFGVAAAYCALELGFVALVRISVPTRSAVPLLAEVLSHSSMLLLLPYVVGVQVPWPHPILFTVEPLIYLGGAATLHIFFKLVTLFSVTQSPPASRLGSLGWMAACVCALVGLQSAYGEWREAVESAHLSDQLRPQPLRVGDSYSRAALIKEGYCYPVDMAGKTGMNAYLQVALPEDAPTQAEPVSLIVEFLGDTPATWHKEVSLSHEWLEIQIPPEEIPAGTQTCNVSWREAASQNWAERFGFSSLDSEVRQVLLGGPRFYEAGNETASPNLLFVLVEGLGAEHVGSLGYKRRTTPNLDEFAKSAMNCTWAYTPTPEASAAAMTLLTGVNPLVHGYLGAYRGPLPSEIATLPVLLHKASYNTAAFSEGEARDDQDLVHGSGFEAGFDLFNQAVSENKPDDTLGKCAAWIEKHREDKFFAFVRLRTLRNPRMLSRYEQSFVTSAVSPRPLDVYDTALWDTDRALGEFLRRLEALPEFRRTCVVITSTYGFDFSSGWSARGVPRLSESSLRVPLFIRAPGISAGEFRDFARLEDVAPTLTELLGVQFPYRTTGQNLLAPANRLEAISLMGEPVALSLRSFSWRYTWQSGRAPFEERQIAAPETAEFLNMTYYQRQWRQPDNLTLEASLAARYRDRLASFLELRGY